MAQKERAFTMYWVYKNVSFLENYTVCSSFCCNWCLAIFRIISEITINMSRIKAGQFRLDIFNSKDPWELLLDRDTNL